MIPIYQTILDSQNGNCYAACLASILECSLEEIPNFMTCGPDEFNNILTKWLEAKNFTILSVNINRDESFITAMIKDVYSIGTIKSPRFEDALHAVVCKGFNIIHDPHPDVSFPYEEEVLYFDVIIIKDLKKYYEERSFY